MKYVIDCSFSSALFLPDEKSDSVQSFFVNIKSADNVYIPSLWWHETANVLSVAMKRKRLSYNVIIEIIELIDTLPLETDMNYGAHYLKTLFELSRSYKISSYDAAYVELALRTKSKLMSLDTEIIKAARLIGL